MASRRLPFMILIFYILTVDANPTTNSTLSFHSILDPKRRSDLVNETFLEQKDILLDMLETKLKEVREKKKKKSERSTDHNLESSKCDNLTIDMDLKLKAHGISAVGETDVLLKFGTSGKGNLNLNATGISNVGSARLDLGIGEGAVYIPGLENLFVGRPLIKLCGKQNEKHDNNIETDEVRLRDRAKNDVQQTNLDGTTQNSTVVVDENVTTDTTVINTSIAANLNIAEHNTTTNVIS